MKQFYDNLGQNIFHTWCCVSFKQKMNFRRFLWTDWMKTKRSLRFPEIQISFCVDHRSSDSRSPSQAETRDIQRNIWNVCLQRTVKHPLSVPRSSKWTLQLLCPALQRHHALVCHISSKEMKYQSIGYSKQVIGHTMNVLQLTPKPFKVRCRFFLPNHARDIFQYHEYWWKKFQYLNNITCVVLPSFLTNGIYVLFSCLNKRKKLIW